MKEISCLLIRHGKTEGNLEKRYVGCRTDESLCEEGKHKLQKMQSHLQKMQLYKKVYVSPMVRCRQTAEILFPKMQQIVVDNLRETDFGDFENKSYLELANDEDYQIWIDSGGRLPFPNGESREGFIKRTKEAFCKILLKECRNFSGEEDKLVPFVVHGGSIMAIMSELTKKDYYDFLIECNEGYIVKILVGEEKIDVGSYDRISIGCDT